jgi:hypothetical protein
VPKYLELVSKASGLDAVLVEPGTLPPHILTHRGHYPPFRAKTDGDVRHWLNLRKHRLAGGRRLLCRWNEDGQAVGIEVSQ